MLKKYTNVVIFLVIFLHFSYTFSYLGKAVNPILAPLLFIYLSIFLTALLVLTNQKSINYIITAPIYRWILFYFTLSLIWIMLPNEQASYARIRLIILSLIFMFTITTLMYFDDDKLSITRKAILLATLIAIFNNFFEFFNPEAFFPIGNINKVLGRSGGFYANSNLSGSSIILGLIFSYGMVPSKYRVFFLIATFLGIIVTFSRAGILFWFTTIFLLSLTKEINKKQLITLCSVITISAIIVLPFLFNLIETKFDEGSTNNLLNRLDFFSSKKQELDGSQDKRLQVAFLAFQNFLENPLTGAGLGFFENWEHQVSTHNIYLQLMAEYGIIGFFIFPLLIFTTIWKAAGEARRLSFVFAAYVLLSGFTTHNHLDTYSYLIAFSLMASMTFRSKMTSTL